MEINGITSNIDEGRKRFKFRKRERLKLRSDISLLFESGRSVQSEDFVIVYRNNRLDYSRIAVAVKRKFGKANRRNKLRRWVRECFRTNPDRVPKGYDFLVIARKPLSVKFKTSTYWSVSKSLIELFERIINEESNTRNH